MPREESWKPTKAEQVGGRWRASRDIAHVSRRSRFSADLLIEAYAAALREYARGTLVDVGCGRAPYFGMYQHLISRSIGVDWPNSPHAGDQVDVVSDLNVAIDLPDQIADTVLCTDVLEHIFEPQKLWEEMARITRPGGMLILGVPFFYWIHEQPFDYHRYTQFALRRYAENAGFDIVAIRVVGGLPHVLVDLACKGAPGPILSRCMALIASLVAVGLKRMRFRDSKFPLAYVLVARRTPAQTVPAAARPSSIRAQSEVA